MSVDIQAVDHGRVVRDGMFQPRAFAGGALHDPEEVDRMLMAGRAAGYASGFDPSAWDPPDVWDDGTGKMWLLCGFHRMALAETAGVPQVDVRVHHVDSAAALRIATRGNLKIRPHDPLEEAAIFRRLFDQGMTAKDISHELDRRSPDTYTRRAALDYLSPGLKDEVRRRALRVEYAEVIGEAAKAGATPGAQAWLRDLARDTKARVEVFRALVAGVVRRADDSRGGAGGELAQFLLFDVPPDAVIVATKAELGRITSVLALRDAWKKAAVAGQGLVKRLRGVGDGAPPEVLALMERARLETLALNESLGLGSEAEDGGEGWSTAHAVAKADDSVGEARVAARPILRRWVGSKVWLLPQILPRIRAALRPGGVFVDPFGGSGAVTVGLGPEKGVLGEAAEDLVALYRSVRDAPAAVHTEMQRIIEAGQHATGSVDPGAKPVYEWIRALGRQKAIPAAARIIYLVATSFNGIYRVNAKGEFNVPWGNKPHPSLPTEADLEAFAGAMASVSVAHQDFRATAERAAKPGDVLYMDPPYAGAFDLYVPADWRFTQDVLVATAVATRNRGAYVLVSQPADAAPLWEAAGATITRHARTSKVGGSRRKAGDELLVELAP